MTDSELSIPNMTLLRRGCDDIGGGVALYYHKRLKMNIISDTDLSFTDTLWCSHDLESGDRFTIGVIYRSPTSTAEHTDMLVEGLQRLNARQIIGDFNLPRLYSKGQHPTNGLEHKFREVFYLVPLYNHVFNHIRMKVTDRPSILNLALTSNALAIESIAYESPFGRSDHVVLVFDYVSSDETKVIRKVDIGILREAVCELSGVHLDFSDSKKSLCIQI